MWVEKTNNGKYKFREFYKDPLTNKKKNVSITVSRNTRNTRKEAQIKLDAKITKRLHDIQYGKIKHGVRLQALSEEWLDDYKNRVRANTLANAKSRVRRIMWDIAPDTLIEKITSNYLANYFNDLLYKQKLKNGTVSHIKQTMNLLLNYAVLHDYLKTNPLERVRISYRKEDGSANPKEKFLEDDELHEILNYEYKVGKQYGRFCEFLYLTGMRYGEAAGLTPNDIVGNVADINGTLIKLPKQDAYKQPGTKTKSGMRKITLSKKAVDIIHKQQSDFPDSQFIFRTKQKYYMPEVTIDQQLKRAKKELGIDKKLDCHVFRHTHISKLAELGVPLYVIQDRVGHAEDKTTSLIYLHVTKKAQQKLDSKLDKL